MNQKLTLPQSFPASFNLLNGIYVCVYVAGPKICGVL